MSGFIWESRFLILSAKIRKAVLRQLYIGGTAAVAPPAADVPVAATASLLVATTSSTIVVRTAFLQQTLFRWQLVLQQRPLHVVELRRSLTDRSTLRPPEVTGTYTSLIRLLGSSLICFPENIISER